MPQNILDQFTPDIFGIFWLTPHALSLELQGFEDFNYLFDGLISQYLYADEKKLEKRSHIFFTENYTNRIFLAHIKTNGSTKSQISSDIDEQIALFKTTNKTILIMDTTNESWLAEFTKRYPHLQFRQLL